MKDVDEEFEDTAIAVSSPKRGVMGALRDLGAKIADFIVSVGTEEGRVGRTINGLVEELTTLNKQREPLTRWDKIKIGCHKIFHGAGQEHNDYVDSIGQKGWDNINTRIQEAKDEMRRAGNREGYLQALSNASPMEMELELQSLDLQVKEEGLFQSLEHTLTRWDKIKIGCHKIFHEAGQEHNDYVDSICQKRWDNINTHIQEAKHEMERAGNQRVHLQDAKESAIAASFVETVPSEKTRGQEQNPVEQPLSHAEHRHNPQLRVIVDGMLMQAEKEGHSREYVIETVRTTVHELTAGGTGTATSAEIGKEHAGEVAMTAAAALKHHEQSKM